MQWYNQFSNRILFTISMKTLIGTRIFVVMNEMRRFVKRRTSCRLIGLYKIETDRWYQICAAFLKWNNETAAWVTTRIISDIHTQFKILIYERTQYFATYSVWYNMTKRLCWVRSCNERVAYQLKNNTLLHIQSSVLNSFLFVSM